MNSDLMPSEEELNDFLLALPLYDPYAQLTEEQRAALRQFPTDGTESLKFLLLERDMFSQEGYQRLQNQGVTWFSHISADFLYEVLIASYLPLVANKDLVDFDVAIDKGIYTKKSVWEPTSGEGPPCPILHDFVGKWVRQYLAGGGFTTATAPIVRRAWLMRFHSPMAEMESLSAGHQILIVAQRERDAANTIIFYTVDNMESIRYKYPIHWWLENALRHHVAEQMPGFQVKEVNGIRNCMPIHPTIGSCMSVSFRAMMLFSFLHDPLSLIYDAAQANAESDRGKEGDRFMVLIYLQLLRMRHFFLNEGKLWQQRGCRVVYLTKDPLSMENDFLHSINTPQIWFISTAINEYAKQKGLNAKMLCRKYWDTMDSRSEKDVANNLVFAKHITPYVFNPDLRAPIASIFIQAQA